MVSKSGKRKCRDVITGVVSLGIGVTVLTTSSLLLIQSLCIHKREGGPFYKRVYSYPFQNSNWLKSSIPTIVVSSFGIVLGSVQILSSLVLIFVNKKFRILGLVVWLGAHLMIFIFNIICFSLAVSIRAHEHKDSYFWTIYQFRSEIIHNLEGHAYCSILAINSVFILITVSTYAPSLNIVQTPIYLPPSVY